MHHTELRGLALILFSACSFTTAAHHATDTPHAVGVVEQPCANLTQHTGEEHVPDDWAGLCRYHAENAALRPTAAPRVVFMGDSITESWKVLRPDFFGEGYVDRGVSGQTTGQMLLRFRQDVIALKPVVVHLMAGTNDFAGNGGPTSVEAVRNNIISMVELALANDIRVVLASVPPASGFPWRPSVTDVAQPIVDFNEWLQRYARERNLIYVDYHEALADERDAMKQTFAEDGVHPNKEGYVVMEPLAREAIAEALAGGRSSSGDKPVGRPHKAPKGAHADDPHATLAPHG